MHIVFNFGPFILKLTVLSTSRVAVCQGLDTVIVHLFEHVYVSVCLYVYKQNVACLQKKTLKTENYKQYYFHCSDEI